MLHVFREADAPTSLPDTGSNKFGDTLTVCRAERIGSWQCRAIVVLHVAYNVFMNVIWQQG
jgi:hypothetical protein